MWGVHSTHTHLDPTLPTSFTAHPNIHSKIACLSWRIQYTLHRYVCTFLLCCVCSSVASTSWDTFPSQTINLCFFFCMVGSHNERCPHIWRLLFAANFFYFFSVPLRRTYYASLRTWWTIYVSIRIVSETVCLQNLRNGWNSVSTVQCFSQFFLYSWIAFIYSCSILLTFILIHMLVISMIVKILWVDWFWIGW